MKKVRKSLALDVMDCQAMPKSKRKLLKAEKYSIKVKKNKHVLRSSVHLTHPNPVCLLPFFRPQEEPVCPLVSSSFCNKQHENILDQGFLLGPSDSAIFPSMAPPVPVSSTFILKRGVKVRST